MISHYEPHRGDRYKKFLTSVYRRLEPTLTKLEFAALGATFIRAILIVFNLAKSIGPLGIAILGIISTPFTLSIMAFRDIFEISQLMINKNIGQRKTKLGTGLMRLGLAGVGLAIVFGTFFAAPIVMPLIFLCLVSTRIYTDWYTKKNIKYDVQINNDYLQNKMQLLQRALIEADFDSNNLQVQQKAWELYQIKLGHKIPHKLIQLKYIEKRKYTHLITLVAVGFLVGGTIFPPLLLVGLSIMIITRIASNTLKEKELNEISQLENEKKQINILIEEASVNAHHSLARSPLPIKHIKLPEVIKTSKIIEQYQTRDDLSTRKQKQSELMNKSMFRKLSISFSRKTTSEAPHAPFALNFKP